MAELTPKSLFAPVLRSLNLTYTLFQGCDLPFLIDIVNLTLSSNREMPPELSNSPSIRQYIINTALRPHDTRGERSKDAGIYIVRLMEPEGEKIGLVSIMHRADNFPLEIGFSFLPPYRNKGYGSEAAGRIMSYWKNEWGFDKICALVLEENTISRKLIQKIGLQENGWVSLSGTRMLFYSSPGIPREEGREIVRVGKEPNENESIILD